jgi:hypothetical protein
MQGYFGDLSFTYNYDVTLAANQLLTCDGVRTDTDSDFLLLGLILNAFTSILFTVQFRDSGGNYFSSSPILAANINAQGPLPYTFMGKPRVFPPGSQITTDLQEQSGLQNIIQLGFVGIKRFVVPPPICGPEAMSTRMGIR